MRTHASALGLALTLALVTWFLAFALLALVLPPPPLAPATLHSTLQEP